MKLWLWIPILLVPLAGCSGQKSAEKARDENGAGRPLVHAANYPLKHFAERISAPWVDVRLPVPVGVDPAFWKPEPEDVLALQQADLIVLNGASYETWLSNVSLSPSKLVDTSARFRDRLIPLKDVRTHSHGPEGAHEHSGTAVTTWLDFGLAVEQARAIKVAFVARWPKYKGRFEAQFEDLAQELGALDREIGKIVASNPSLPVFFSHPIYQYFQAKYGMNGYSVHWEPNAMPSDEQWVDIVELAKGHPARHLIWEGKPLPETKERLKTLGIESVVFDPCAITPKRSEFSAMMARNVESLRKVYPK